MLDECKTLKEFAISISTKYVFAAKFNDFASKISPLIFNDLAAILNDLAANLFQIRR